MLVRTLFLQKMRPKLDRKETKLKILLSLMNDGFERKVLEIKISDCLRNPLDDLDFFMSRILPDMRKGGNYPTENVASSS